MKKLLFLLLTFQSALCLAQDTCETSRMNTELEQLLERDQGLRRAAMLAGYDQQFGPSAENKAKLEKIVLDLRESDQKNRVIVRNIFESCGWPDARQLSYNANTALFLVVQHSNKDDRAKYFPYFEKLYENNQLHSFRYVMMVDRMRYDQGLGQLYGTQFIPGKEGVEQYGVVDEPEKLNERREKIGMLRILVFDEKYPPQVQRVVTVDNNK
ncbi:hypothetical protein ACO0LC_20500 [Undibacterium sp. JH2W]|uniref:hypothetical protein n=1 Tax=Undibacterium sp. JH2W TaxID=3413037 RepID=UPI003BF2BAA9